MLNACGGGGGEPPAPVNVAPSADAGAAQTVNVGTTVVLNGSASSDIDGTIAGYAWAQTAGTAVALNNGSSANTSFVAPQGTTTATLTFRLIVTDNLNAASTAATVTITVNGNAMPIASVALGQTVAAAATVTLDGTASSDPDGTVAAYAWTQMSGTPVTLNNAQTAQPSFVSPVAIVVSTLTFRLIVTDNRGVASSPVTVTVTVNAVPNVVPVANAGAAQTVNAGATVLLEGNASSDPDGAIVSYSWTQTAGAAVTLNNANTSAPSFTAPVGPSTTTLAFQLVVTDNRNAASAASTVVITVRNNSVPIAVAGPAQTVLVGAAVTLDGSASFDSNGSISAFAWTQTSGPAVVLTGASSSRPTFTAPGTPATLVFSLVVTDNVATTSSPSAVTITVSPGVTMSGVVRFQRVPFLAGIPYGLNYANPVWQPARGITVNATTIGGAVVATAATDSSGNYTMTVPSGMNVNIRAVAQLVRDGAQPLPRWNMRVQDGIGQGPPYDFFNGVVSSNAGTHNIDIPSGIAANGVRTVGRNASSGPYAILDTVYTAMQLVLGAAPNTSFPDLYINWGGQSEGTFFTTADGQHIALMSDVTQDTDEFDQHVVAHEFGHYIEENFSRADSIGGSHSLGDKLDMRVAFGEGFGYAFAAIALNDSFARDSFAFNGTQMASVFDVETNPSLASGCWCSETSVWSILWDLHDSSPDGNDNISLPFSAIWDVLTNAQRLTPSVTSIFSFTTALKAAQPASVGLINPLLSAQNINSGAIDAFATNETFLPYPAMTLPLIPGITRGGGPVIVRSIGDASRHYNKAGNRALLRFTATSTGPITVSVATSNIASSRDPDFLVWSSGTVVWGGVNGSAEHPETETFAVTAGQTYIIDAYDCANGCSGSIQGTPGDYNLTVTIN